MNKNIKTEIAIAIIIIFAIIFAAIIWCVNSKQEQNQTTTQSTKELRNKSGKNAMSSIQINNQDNDNGNYLGSYFEGNYVWGGAMNLAWKDLKESIVHEDIKIQTDDKKAQEMADNFNRAAFSKNDLDEKSYYIKSGYGQKTVELINKESKEKFPTKRLNDLKLELDPKDIISYAYFLKEVEYLNQFKEKNVNFENADVKGFYANNVQQKENIKIVRYWNDDKFIISLQLKDNNDQLFIAKGFEMDLPQGVVDEINGLTIARYENISADDLFEMPKIHVDHRREYKELINKTLANKDFTDYFIAEMFENIKFDMDQKGARVESEAVIRAGWLESSSEAPRIKKFILDQPFWIIMKKTNSENPYFILGVNDEKIMEKI
jgi:hypothetical protein